MRAKKPILSAPCFRGLRTGEVQEHLRCKLRLCECKCQHTGRELG